MKHRSQDTQDEKAQRMFSRPRLSVSLTPSRRWYQHWSAARMRSNSRATTRDPSAPAQRVQTSDIRSTFSTTAGRFRARTVACARAHTQLRGAQVIFGQHAHQRIQLHASKPTSSERSMKKRCSINTRDVSCLLARRITVHLTQSRDHLCTFKSSHERRSKNKQG